MGDLIKSLHSLSNNKEQSYKFTVTFKKDGKAICMLGKNGEDRNLLFSGPVQEVSDNIENRFKRFLSIVDEPSDELQDNLEEVEEEVAEEEEKEAATTAKVEANKAAREAKTKKAEAKKDPPAKTALETILEKLDKPTKTAVVKNIDRIKKGSTDADIMKFLTDSFTNMLKPVIEDAALIDKALAEILATAGKKEEPKTEETGMFSTVEATPAPAPAPKVVEEVKKPAPVAQPVVQQPVAQPAGLDMDEGDLF